MIRSCVTVSLIPEARGGPFVFWDDLPAACRTASELGFDAIEIFPPEPEAVEESSVRRLLDEYGLKLAAVGSGAGWVRHKLHLCLPEADKRAAARDSVRRTIDAAGRLGASAIVGSMQGRWSDAVNRETALDYLTDALRELAGHARQYGVPLLYEPLNRYETNLCNTLESAVGLLESSKIENVRLLADLFHENIEEQNIADALREAGRWIGHVHFVDSNRRAAGMGHIDFRSIAAALREVGYNGYVSAEALPYPDSESAARATIEAYRKHFPTAK